MNNDTLSDLLRTLRLLGAKFDVCTDGLPCDAPGGDVLLFAGVLRGEAQAAAEGEEITLETGDVVLLPRARASLAVRPGGAVVRGWLRHDPAATRLLMDTWPAILHLPAARCSDWMVRMAYGGARAQVDPLPGADAVLLRFAEALLADIVRRHVAGQPQDAKGWLAGLRDRYVSRALAAIHDSPAHPWTVEELGHRVGLSRSALHDRFNQALGQPPNQYLARWRIQLGSQLLRETRRPVASIAEDVGYESEAAFSRAFKRMVGQPPASWRRTQGARELVTE